MKNNLGDITDLKYTPYEIADILERMACRVNGASMHDYGMDKMYTAREAHTISFIGTYPGITVTDFAKKWNKTKGAVSQMASKLEAEGLITRVKSSENNKNVQMYLTEKGKEFDRKHQSYDFYEMLPMLSILIQNHSVEEVDSAFSIVDEYMKIVQKIKSI